MLQLIGLGHDQILLIGGQLRFGSQYVERGHGSDFQLLLVVAIELLRNSHRRFLYLYIFTVENQFPVIIRSLGHGRDHLLRELRIRHFDVVFRFDDVARVGQDSESVEQRLRKRRRQHRSNRRIKK